MEPTSRQVRRWFERQVAKQERAANRVEAAKAARRALLKRQTRREKSGFYVGPSVASTVTPSRSRITKRKVNKGKAFCRILTTDTVAGRELAFHATKGWRSNRAAL